MSGFNEWLERKYPEYLLEQGAVNPAGTPNSFTPISKGKEEFYKYDKDGKIPSVNSTLTPNNPTPKTSMGMGSSDNMKDFFSSDPYFNNTYLQKQIKDYGQRNVMLKNYISFKGGVDKLHNWEYGDLVYGIAQKMFDKSIFPPDAAEKVLENRRDLDERNKRALEQYISYQEQPISSNQQQPMASNRQQPMASNRNRVAQTNKPRTGLLKKIFRR